MAQVATKNIYEFLTDESRVEEAPVAASAPKKVSSTGTKTTSKPTGNAKSGNRSNKIQANRPAPTKEGQFYEKPVHSKVGEQGAKKHFTNAKPVKGRQFDKKSATFKKDEKYPVVDAELAKLNEKPEAEKEEVAEEEKEPEIETLSFEEYKKSLESEKKPVVEARKPNEGMSDPLWDRMTAVKKDNEEEFFPAKDGQKVKKTKERKEKAIVNIEIKYAAPKRDQREDRRPPRANNERGPQKSRDGKFKGPRDNKPKQGGKKPEAKVNVQDVKAFPSLG